MKSFARFSSSVRAARRPPSSPCFPPDRAALSLCAPSGVDSLASRTGAARPPRVTAARTFHNTRVTAAAVQRASAAAPLPVPVAVPERTEAAPNVYRLGARPTAHLSPNVPHIKPQSSAAALVHLRTVMEGDVIPALCARLARIPGDERADGLATLLGACAECGLEAHSPLVVRLINECLELLSGGGVRVSQLCHLGEAARALEGRRSALVVTEVLASLCGAVGEDVVSPSEAVRIYSLLALCHDPASRRHKVLLSALHRSTRRQVQRLNASQVSDVLQSLLKLQQRQVGDEHLTSARWPPR